MTSLPSIRSRRVLRLLAAALAGFVVAALAVLAAPAASAHDVLIATDPADGAVLDTAPEAVTFTFDQAIQNFEPVVDVFGPNGNSFATSEPRIVGTDASATMAAGPAGEYRAVFRIVSSDGHPINGQITFTLTDAAAGDATGTPVADEADEGGGIPPWVWAVAGAVALIALIVGVVIVTRRNSDD